MPALPPCSLPIPASQRQRQSSDITLCEGLACIRSRGGAVWLENSARAQSKCRRSKEVPTVMVEV